MLTVTDNRTVNLVYWYTLHTINKRTLNHKNYNNYNDHNGYIVFLVLVDIKIHNTRHNKQTVVHLN